MTLLHHKSSLDAALMVDAQQVRKSGKVKTEEQVKPTVNMPIKVKDQC